MRRLLLAILCGVAATVPAAAEPPIRLAADEWMPFNGAPGAPPEGYAIDLARAVFAERGRGVAYTVMAWKRALRETARGTFDAVVGAEVSDAPGFIFPEQEIGRYRMTFFARADEPWRFEGLASLDGRRIGVVRGYTYPQWLRNYQAAHPAMVDEIIDDDPLGTNLRKLIAGRIDVIPSNPYTLAWLAEAKGLGHRVARRGVNFNDAEKVVFIAFSPANPESRVKAEQFSRGVAAMRADGRLRALLKRYGLSDWRGDRDAAATEEVSG